MHKNVRLIKSIALVISAAVILSVYYFLREKFGISIVCPIYKITGFYCAGCGMTRMCVYIINFDFYKAFRSNMLAFVSVIPVTLCIGSLFYEYIFERKLIGKTEFIRSIYLKTMIVLIVLYSILRNIPMFDFLAPAEF